jgi:diguanylate cyclase (GGDEF)-like protein/PAS domain S-box-containing protein
MPISEKPVKDAPGNRMQELPATLDRLLLTAPSVSQLYPELTRFLTSIDGIDGAWIGYPDDQQMLHPQAIAGDGVREYLSGATIPLPGNPSSPVARAWTEGETQFVADLQAPGATYQMPYWRDRAAHFGWRSVCAVPVTQASGNRLILVLYSRRAHFFAGEAIQALIHHVESVLQLAIERLKLLETLKYQQQTLALYKASMDASSNGVFIAENRGSEFPLCYVNAAYERITGYSAAEQIGKSCSLLEDGGTGPAERAMLRKSLGSGTSCAIEIENHRKDGSPYWLSLTLAPVRDADGVVTHFVGILNEITALKNASLQSERANAMYGALMNAAELVIRAQTERELLDELCSLLVNGGLFSQCWVVRPNTAGELEIQSIYSSQPVDTRMYLPNVFTGDETRILSVRAWRRARLEYSNDRLADEMAEPIRKYYQHHGLHATAVVPVYRDGDLWGLLTLISSQANILGPEVLELIERIGRLVGHGLDALDLRQILEEERQHQSWLARHDALTDILNRRGIIERLEEATARARRHGKLLAVAVLDLDGFKLVNEAHGHRTGDLLLRSVADRLQSTLRQSDAVGRLGSDEFVLVLEDFERPEDLSLLLSRIQSVINGPVQLANDRSASVRATIGLTVFPADDSSPERLLRHAERALYTLKESKEEPEQRWMVYHAAEDEQKHQRQKTIRSLFRSGNLVVHYQPVIDLQSGRVSGIEALAPAEFLPQLTAADLVTLTHQVLAASTNDLQLLDAAGFELSAGINFEPGTLADPKAMQELQAQIEASGVSPQRIILELLERADSMSVAGSQQALQSLKDCGVRIALDDVGSAYSSLLRVKELPVDMIKLDRSFLIGLEKHPHELRFLMNLVHLARALGLSFVAEGIECPASGDALAALGVKLAQGYSIARPMPFDALLAWLRQYQPVPWTRPTSVLGAVALQLRDLDASARMIEQRPSFLRHLVARHPELDSEMDRLVSHADPGGRQLSAAYRAWHAKIAAMSQSAESVDFASFEYARTAYEEEMFRAALDANSKTHETRPLTVF